MHELKTTTVELGKESNSSVMQRNGSACGRAATCELDGEV